MYIRWPLPQHQEGYLVKNKIDFTHTHTQHTHDKRMKCFLGVVAVFSTHNIHPFVVNLNRSDNNILCTSLGLLYTRRVYDENQISLYPFKKVVQEAD